MRIQGSRHEPLPIPPLARVAKVFCDCGRHLPAGQQFIYTLGRLRPQLSARLLSHVRCDLSQTLLLT